MQDPGNSLSSALEDSIRAGVLGRFPDTLQWRSDRDQDTRSQRTPSTATLDANPEGPASTMVAPATTISASTATPHKTFKSGAGLRRDSAWSMKQPPYEGQGTATAAEFAGVGNSEDLHSEPDGVTGANRPARERQSEDANTDIVPAESREEGQHAEDAEYATEADDLRDWTEVSEVQRILDHGTNEDGTVPYFVRWKGYGEEENMWVGEEGVNELAKERYWIRRSTSARAPRLRLPGKLDGFTLADLPAQGDDQAWQQWTPPKYRWKGGAIYETDRQTEQAWLDTQKHRLRVWQDKHSRIQVSPA